MRAQYDLGLNPPPLGCREQRLERGARVDVERRAAFLVGDQSELTGGGIGVVVGAHVTQWAAPSVGFTLGATVRTAIGVFPSVYAGLTLRF